MGKLDHIPELSGADNFSTWHHQVQLALKSEGLWQYVSEGKDIMNYAEYGVLFPMPADPSKPTMKEIGLIKSWYQEDARAKSIISRKMSPVVFALLPEDLSAREQWKLLAEHFGRTDITSHFELRSKLLSVQLKDANNSSRYLSEFVKARHRFAEMGAMFTDDEAIFLLLHGLPKTPDWNVFHQLTFSHYAQTSTSSSTSTSPVIVTFDDIARRFSAEAIRQGGKRTLPGPGAEYANFTAPSINPTTGLKKT